MLRSLSVQRYRAFVDEARLELKPVTLLFGRNSAGKSALLRAVPLVSASIVPASVNRTGPLALEHDAAMRASFADLRSRLTPHSDLRFRLTFGAETPLAAASIAYTVRDVQDLSRTGQVIESVSFSMPPDTLVLTAQLDLDTGVHVVHGAGGTVRFEGMLPRPGVGLAPECAAVVEQLGRHLDVFARSVDWLGPLRAVVPRVCDPVERPMLLANGLGATELLVHPANRELLDWVDARTRELFGHGVSREEDATGVRLVADRGDGRAVPLVDVGSGVGQCLPVLAHLARVARGDADGRIVLLEQPEAHLHADAEVALGHAVLDALRAVRSRAPEAPPCLVFETHSEAVVLALELGILEGELPPADLLACWVSQRDDGSASLRPISFDRSAIPSPPWPAGAFSETADLARRILTARRQVKP